MNKIVMVLALMFVACTPPSDPKLIEAIPPVVEKVKCDLESYLRKEESLPDDFDDWESMAKLWCGQMAACGWIAEDKVEQCIKDYLGFVKEAEQMAKEIEANPSAYPVPVGPSPPKVITIPPVTLTCEDSVEGQANPEICK